ncbi:MAG: response regulator [Chitinophagaceae bacterium]
MIQKVLIIEDNFEIRENTAELLEVNNYKVLVAENGSIGFYLAKQYLPDIILCDIMMPETDGWKFLQLARDDNIIRYIPLIFFSANSGYTDNQKSLIRQGDEFLFKPFSSKDLIRIIERGLNNRKNNHYTTGE